MNRWVAILSPADGIAAGANEAIAAVGQALLERQPGTRLRLHRVYEDALLFSYLFSSRNDQLSRGHALACLEMGQSQNSEQNIQYLGLHGGLCGLGWVREHLSRLFSQFGSPHSEFAGLNDQFDEHLSSVLEARPPWYTTYDLISGLVGFGSYFLERWPAEGAVRGLELVVDHLDHTAVRIDPGLSWYTAPEHLPDWQREQAPEGYYNLGVAHGVPGIIHFLSEVYALGILQERVRRMLEGAVEWLIAQPSPGGSLSRFGTWVSHSKTTASRPTWCYGDLGIVAVLLQVARRTGREDWSQFAHELLDRCLSWPMEKTGVGDTPLCHGSAGMAHIFNRLYQTEGDPRCLAAAIAWFEKTISMWKPGTGVGGFSALVRPDPEKPPYWEGSPAFLDGSCGIALALLAALTPMEPSWDRMLLLSGRSDLVIPSGSKVHLSAAANSILQVRS